MDTGRGQFIAAASRKALEEIADQLIESGQMDRGAHSVFEKGERLVIKDSVFKVDNITKTHLVLRLQRKDQP